MSMKAMHGHAASAAAWVGIVAAALPLAAQGQAAGAGAVPAQVPAPAAASAAPTATASPAIAEAARPPAITEVVLDNGLTLQDWITVVRAREPEPSLATGAQAAAYVRRYGPYRELLDLVYRATQRPELLEVTASGAANQLALLTQARRQLGDWPDLVLASATARAVNGDAAGAVGDLRRWLAAAPPSAPLRPQVAEQILVAETDPAATLAWLRGRLPPEVPAELRRPVPAVLLPYAAEMRKAAACLGAPRAFVDFEILTEVTQASGQKSQVGPTRYWVMDNALRANPADTSSTVVSSATINSGLGPSWTRQEFRQSDGQIKPAVGFTTDIRCENRLFPARVGQRFEMTWRHAEDWAFTEPPQSIVREYRDVVEVVAGPLAAEQVQALAPRVKVDPALLASAAVFEGRLTRTPTVISRKNWPDTAVDNGTYRVFLFDGPNLMLVMRNLPDVTLDMTLRPATGTPPAAAQPPPTATTTVSAATPPSTP